MATWREILGKDLTVGGMNLSVYAMFDRWIGHGLAPLAGPGAYVLWPSHNPAVLVAAGVLILAAVLLAAWLFRGAYDRKSRAAVAEWSAVFLAAALFGTLTWKHYLVVLMLPMTLFVAAWRDESVAPAFRRRLRTLTWLAFLPSLAGANNLIGGGLAARLQTGSILTLMCLFILGMLFWYQSEICSLSATRPDYFCARNTACPAANQ
jgi:hypothetical protein